LSNSNCQLKFCFQGYFLQNEPVLTGAISHNQLTGFAISLLLQGAESCDSQVQAVRSLL